MALLELASHYCQTTYTFQTAAGTGMIVEYSRAHKLTLRMFIYRTLTCTNLELSSHLVGPIHILLARPRIVIIVIASKYSIVWLFSFLIYRAIYGFLPSSAQSIILLLRLQYFNVSHNLSSHGSVSKFHVCTLALLTI